jgi:hypothetical protein
VSSLFLGLGLTIIGIFIVGGMTFLIREALKDINEEGGWFAIVFKVFLSALGFVAVGFVFLVLENV